MENKLPPDSFYFYVSTPGKSEPPIHHLAWFADVAKKVEYETDWEAFTISPVDQLGSMKPLHEIFNSLVEKAESQKRRGNWNDIDPEWDPKE